MAGAIIFDFCYCKNAETVLFLSLPNPRTLPAACFLTLLCSVQREKRDGDRDVAKAPGKKQNSTHMHIRGEALMSHPRLQLFVVQ